MFDMADGMKRKGGSGDGKFQNSRKGEKAKRVFAGRDDVRVKKMNWKTKKFFQRKARDYDSDDDDKDEEDEVKVEKERFIVMKDELVGRLGNNVSDDDDGVDGEEDDEDEASEDENGEVQPGVLRFSLGCKAFRLAFERITKSTSSAVDDDILVGILHLGYGLGTFKMIFLFNVPTIYDYGDLYYQQRRSLLLRSLLKKMLSVRLRLRQRRKNIWAGKC